MRLGPEEWALERHVWIFIEEGSVVARLQHRFIILIQLPFKRSFVFGQFVFGQFVLSFFFISLQGGFSEKAVTRSLRRRESWEEEIGEYAYKLSVSFNIEIKI